MLSAVLCVLSSSVHGGDDATLFTDLNFNEPLSVRMIFFHLTESVGMCTLAPPTPSSGWAVLKKSPADLKQENDLSIYL